MRLAPGVAANFPERHDGRFTRECRQMPVSATVVSLNSVSVIVVRLGYSRC